MMQGLVWPKTISATCGGSGVHALPIIGGIAPDMFRVCVLADRMLMGVVLSVYMLFSFMFISSQDGYCQVNQSKCGATLSKFYNTPSGNVSALVSAIYEKGPISVAIDASHKSFSFYSHGVYFEPECGEFIRDCTCHITM